MRQDEWDFFRNTEVDISVILDVRFLPPVAENVNVTPRKHNKIKLQLVGHRLDDRLLRHSPDMLLLPGLENNRPFLLPQEA